MIQTEIQNLKNLESFMGQPFSFFVGEISDEHFEKICRKNSNLRIEQTAEGELIIMPPTLPDTGWRNSDLNTDVNLWNRTSKSGIVFDSSTYFTLPNGARRSPDVTWIKREKWEKLTNEQRKKVSRIIPDFVIELRSSSDSLKSLQDKMQEYIENGVELGWLIDPQKHKVHIYRKDGKTEILDNPKTVSGEDVLEGFELKVSDIW
ncbi:MAG: Uma2 family endonuclease [Aridibacter sp.]